MGGGRFSFVGITDKGDIGMADIYAFEPLWGNWYIDELLGSGSYGTVYDTQVLEKKEDVAE